MSDNKDEKFRTVCPESAKEIVTSENFVKNALFDMKDGQFQNGLSWRMKQCRAVRTLFSNGWKREDILKEFRHNGMTALTANKIIDDALC